MPEYASAMGEASVHHAGGLAHESTVPGHSLPPQGQVPDGGHADFGFQDSS